VLVEVHLLDIQIDLYSQQLVIEFVVRLREELHFQSSQAQMRTDADRTRALLAMRPSETFSL
jgi:FAD synthase